MTLQECILSTLNHLDVGYAGLIIEILNEYFQTYFQRAIDVWNDLRNGGYVETFMYTTHPWLVAMYLLTALQTWFCLVCPNVTQKAFIDAVNKGIITWHAGPVNLQVAMAHDPWLFEYGLKLGISLDQRFDISRKTRQCDVPGLMQTAIPSLVKKGVTGITVGMNEMTPPHAVPRLFVWDYNGDNVMATWHPGGYPNIPGQDPAHPGGLSRNDCLVVDGLSDVLCFAFRTDNSEPPENVEAVLRYYEILRAEFPNAELKASHLEGFFVAADSVRTKLPVICNEISDTWIQGIASDPRCCAEYRAVARVMDSCLQTSECLLSDVRVWNASQFLTKVPEHTWGLSTEGDSINWADDKFQPIQFTTRSELLERTTANCLLPLTRRRIIPSPWILSRSSICWYRNYQIRKISRECRM